MFLDNNKGFDCILQGVYFLSSKVIQSITIVILDIELANCKEDRGNLGVVVIVVGCYHTYSHWETPFLVLALEYNNFHQSTNLRIESQRLILCSLKVFN